MRRTRPAKDEPGDIRVFRPATLSGVEMRIGTQVTAPCPRHWHDEFQLCAVTAGGGNLEHHGSTLSTPRRSLFVVPPGEVHANHTPTGCDFRTMNVDPGLFESASRELGRPCRRTPELRTRVITDEQTLGLFLDLHRALHASDQLRSDTLVLEFLVRFIVRYGEDAKATPKLGKEHKAVMRVQAYIDAHYSDPIRLETLAALVDLSPYHLHRVFVREVGMPPHAYQLQLRIARAKVLLRSSTIADVAMMTGFADQAHFTRHFKHFVAVTPGQFSGRASQRM